jgi:branched-chain amino acid transport system substrate-binding protein
MSGGQASFGEAMNNGIQLAVEQLNSGGGIRGRKVRVIVEDDQSKAEEAATAATKLITRDEVLAILGEAASSNSLAAAPICQANRVPMVTPISTNPDVTKKGDYIFRICFIDPYQGEALARYVRDTLHFSRAAVLVDVKSDYSNGLADFFTRTFTERGGKITKRLTYASGDSDFRAQLTSLGATKPDMIFLPGYYTEVGQIISQARDLGIKQPFVGGDGWESPKLFEIGGSALNGCFYSNHYFVDDPAPEIRRFQAAYKRRYSVIPDSFAALAYDATNVLLDAMKRGKDFQRSTIRDQLARTSNFQGVTGTITLGADRNPVGKKIVVLEIQDNRVQLKGTVASGAHGVS